MGTRWRTEPIPPHLLMDHEMAQNTSRRPQIFVHFEFGVSFSPRHAPNPHSVTYVSRGMRDRAQNFPRQVPPPTTNYLDTPTYQAYQPTRPSPPAPQQSIPQYPPMLSHLEPRRQSRQESRSSGSSHERGSSAPPPWNDSPWDAEPDALGSSALPRQRPRAPTTNAPDYWKALPEVPSRFRLGEDELPWSASSWPGEFGMPDDAEAAEDYSSEVSMKFRDIATPDPNPTSREREDPGRRQELEALSAAMMTIDNGFEDQWWYQGERQQTANPAGDLFTSSAYATATATAEAVPQTPTQRSDGRESLGWAVAQDDSHMSLAGATAYNPSLLVSPMSEYASPRLHRSLTTRSEELFLFN
ncbi:uncharacterized protein CTRU02_208929 [Colletotrichum truncatum]|uniref:Uncharacterized protein n=1 Tax=Colletotrichum truncatum TaxID=5467 RepID=A0ACC3YXT2_COLTU|nr:uncharacterized protein CTRU02_07878 [Colletotrichum truncatum]KAF6790972.1 hypothetical protein CTRU02_07878 [Colletotrichum truncatum]